MDKPTSQLKCYIKQTRWKIYFPPIGIVHGQAKEPIEMIQEANQSENPPPAP